MSLCNYILNFFVEKIRKIKSSIRGIASGTNPNFLTHKIMKDKSDVPVFELRAPTISETRKAIMKLKDGSEGPDGISSTLLKIACTNFKFLKTVHFLFCVSIITNKTAEVWKISQIRALYKGNHKNPNSVSNYRPISSVSVLSKALEDIVSSQLKDHFEKHAIITQNSFGYRNSHSTITLLTSMATNSS